MADDAAEYYWCTKHNAVETAAGCPANVRMGPYPTREAAEQYAETAAQRNEKWEADDEAWRGDR